jgi:REP element-mobilizing transposase RayT
MTAPRQVLPGVTYLVTRRCSERRFFLRPSPVTNEIFLYVLAVAARRFGVQIHAFCVLSNHYHLLVTDPGAQLPAFMQYFGSLVARATNASLGRWEGFWAAATSYSAVSHGGADVIRKAAYVLANPVAAGLVRTGREWPGLWTRPDQLGIARLTARRPPLFFRAGGLPEASELALTLPPGFESAAEFQARVAEAVTELEDRARQEHASKGRPFVGPARVLAQDPYSRPPRWERRRGLNPRVASADRWKRMEALVRLKQFLSSYREALRKLRVGGPDIVFPAGTYLLRVRQGVRCAAFA